MPHQYLHGHQYKPLKHQAPKTVVKEKKAFALPVPARNNTYLYSYLINERGISKETVDKFVNNLNLLLF